MAERVLSIEIGYHVTRVLEIDYKAKIPAIYHAFTFETPEEILDDGVVKSDAKFLDRFRQELMKHKIRTKRVIFTVHSSRIAQREVEIPMVKEKRIHNLLVTNITDYFPVDLTKYQLIHQIIRKKEDEKKIKLSVVAVPNDLLLSYQELAGYCGLVINGIDYAGRSIYNAMKFANGKALAVSLHIDERETILTIIKNGYIDIQRTIGYGVDDAVEALQEHITGEERDSYNKALQLLQTKQCIHDTLEFRQNQKVHIEKDQVVGEQTQQNNTQQEEIKDAVTDALRMLVGNITRVISYYTSNNPDSKVEKITVMGIGAECIGMEELIEQELNLPVQYVRSIGAITSNDSLKKEGFSFATNTVTIGSTLDPMNLQIAKIKFTEEQEKKNEMAVTVSAVICGICVLVSAGLILIPNIEKRGLTSQRTDLEEKINSMQEAQMIYNDFVDTQQKYEDYNMLPALTSTPLDSLLTFVENLEKKMPSDIQLSVLSATESQVVLDVTTTSKYSALDVLMQLRNCDPLTSFQVSGITENVNESQQVQEQFSVTCILEGMEQEDDEIQASVSDEVLEDTMEEDDTSEEDAAVLDAGQ